MIDRASNVFVPPGKKLGALCPQGHNYQKTGRSLRYDNKSATCFDCNREAAQKWRDKNRASHAPDPALPVGTRLADMCDRRHNYQETGRSLVYISSGYCLECLKTNSNKRRQEREKSARLGSNKLLGDLCNQEHEYQDTGRSLRYLSTGRCVDCVRGNVQDYDRTHREARNLSLIKYRANKRQAYREPYTVKQLRDHFAYFGNECAYCGSKDILTIDHVLALNCGGVEAIWNIAPACLSCNSSKCDRPLLEWYPKQPFYSEDRLDFLKGSGACGALS